jgi:hypothetical protein
MDSPPTTDSIKRLVLRLLRPKDRDELRSAVAGAVSPDVEFWHSLGFFRKRRAYYSALRVATALWSYEKVVFEDVFVSKQSDEEDGEVVVVKAALVLVLSIRPRVVFFAPPLLDFPTIAVLHFTRRGGGKYLLARHVDSNSVVALATALSPLHVPWRFVARWLLPVFGSFGVALARALDAASDARDAFCALAGSWLRPLMLLVD